MSSSYDSIPDTMQHIRDVRGFMDEVIDSLRKRALRHDQSKLRMPELEIFNKVTPRLRELTYGSPEYKACLEEMGPALRHHYANNRHHPEHHTHGVADMDLADITEMLCDWKAATLRHDDGDLEHSIRVNAERFGYGEEITNLLCNTARNFGWLSPSS